MDLFSKYLQFSALLFYFIPKLVLSYTIHNEVVWWIAGKKKYAKSPDNAMGYMFSFTFCGTGYWIDATEETENAWHLTNHSQCHATVSKVYACLDKQWCLSNLVWHISLSMCRLQKVVSTLQLQGW